MICKIDKCTGCHACYAVCPVNCISMKEDRFGFLRPEIESEKCIDCKQCEAICPANNPLKKAYPVKTYAAITNDRDDYETTTSGGVATLISKECLGMNGVVYGAAFCTENKKVCHIRVSDIEGLDQIKGSKYVQSELGDTYKNVKKDLSEGVYVVFIGTPCQVAGLKSFLKKDYEGLICIDIVCHGVPSPKYLSQHLKKQKIDKIDSISFREKDGFYLKCYSNENTVYRKTAFKDLYYLGFLRGLFYQECCYSCNYASSERTGDITLGDFWGFDRTKGEFPKKTDCGLSCVLLNTEKGMQFFNSCKDKMTFIQRETTEAVVGNKQLRHPSRKHRFHEAFLKLYLKKGFTYAAKRTLLIDRIGYAILNLIQK